MHPAVSVIVPAYNNAKLLSQTIQSVLGQSYTDFELIIVDDGSTDNTREIIEHFPDRRIRYHYQDNSGLPAAARNTGIRLSVGRYISFLDSDDVWYPEKLGKVLAVFQRHSTVGLVCHNENVRRGSGIIGTKRYGPYKPDMFRSLLFKGNVLSTSATTVVKEVLERVGGFTERRDFYCIEDYDLWMKIARQHVEFYFLSDILGEYRIHESNSSGIFGQGDIKRYYNSLRCVLEENFAHISSPSLSERFKHRRNLADTHYKCGQRLQEQKQWATSHTEQIRALVMYPPGCERYLLALAQTCHQWKHELKIYAPVLTLYEGICRMLAAIVAAAKVPAKLLYRLVSGRRP